MAFGPVRRSDTVALLEVDGIPSRAGYYRYDVLDQDLTRIGELDVSRDKPPKVRNDTTRAIKRTLSGLDVDPITAAELDTIGARIRPYAVLEDASTWPLGVFLFVDSSRPRARAGLSLSGSLHDQGFILDQPNGFTVSYKRGTNIAAALETLADRYGIHRVSIDGTSRTIEAPIAWPAGATTGRKVADELCEMAGFFSPYFDSAGFLTCRAVPAPGAEVAHLRYGDGGRIVADTALESDDLLTAPNRFIAIDDSATGSPIVGVYDLPSSSPISIAQRGFPVSETRSMQGLTDQPAADAAARAMAAESEFSFRLIDFDAIPDYRHDTFDAVLYRGALCRETAWELELDPTAVMTHELRETYQ